MKTKESFKKRINNETIFVINENVAMSTDGIIWDIAKEKKNTEFALKDDVENIFYILTEKNARNLIFTEQEINNIVEFLKQEEAASQSVYIYFLKLKYEKNKRKKKINPSVELHYQNGIIEITTTIYMHELFNLKFSIYQKNIEFKTMTCLTQKEIDEMNTELYNDNGLTTKKYIYQNLLTKKDIEYHIQKELRKYDIAREIGIITLY